MRALFFTALLLTSVHANAFFGDIINDNNNNTEACTCQPSDAQINNQNNIALVNGNMDVSKNMLELSMALLSQSQMMVTSGTSVNEDYVNAMLTLSQDIGTMADRIGEMADRIVATAAKPKRRHHPTKFIKSTRKL